MALDILIFDARGSNPQGRTRRDTWRKVPFCFVSSRNVNKKIQSKEEDWVAFRDVVYNTAIAYLDQNTHKHQDWFDDKDVDIQKLLDEKLKSFRSLQQDTTFASKKAAYYSIKSKVQEKLTEMQDSWLSRKADEIQKYTDSNNSKRFYDALKTIYGPQSSGTSPLLSAGRSTLLTEKNAILKRWAEHFNNILNRPSSINAEAIDQMLQVAINTSMTEPPKDQSMMFSALLSDAFCDDEETSFKVRYRTDGRLYNLRRLQAKTKVEEYSVRYFLFADDCAVNTPTEAQTQQSMNSFSTACRNFSLTISTKNTEELHQPAPQKTYTEPTSTAEGKILKAVDKFT
ncbi:hypothetical protein NDU88_004250 [Pleurodeles waltl]|uniref:Uncharacterized protein n=1 Tax=Pleurodeles waltl TaxID=8319 RepID=A0AAV7RHN7_PLEWA|nr:hypothetical protein NDU88_004250 [Pleurodeles waltl]